MNLKSQLVITKTTRCVVEVIGTTVVVWKDLLHRQLTQSWAYLVESDRPSSVHTETVDQLKRRGPNTET